MQVIVSDLIRGGTNVAVLAVKSGGQLKCFVRKRRVEETTEITEN
jgi:hypothetical protein